MFLTIIIPIYNTQKYLSECLTSLLDQDISNEDYEIICIDDGSTDSSLSIANRFSNIKVIHQENAGVSVARNNGMDSAIGVYYWFVDSDDFVRRNSLEKMKKICAKEQCDILSFRLYYFDDNESEKLKKELDSESEITSNSSLRAQSSMLIRKEFIGSLRWHPGIEVGEDSLFIRELMIKDPYVLEIDDTIYFYRQHISSAMHSSSKRMLSHVNGALIAKELYESPNGRCAANANLLRMFVIYAMVSIARNTSDKRYQALSIMRKAKLFPFKMPKEVTSTNNFHTTREDIFGKIYGFLCTNSGSRLGFILLRAYFILRG